MRHGDVRVVRELQFAGGRSGGVADLRLTGRCSSGGSTVSIAGEVLPTLKQFATVRRVVLRDAQGSTLDPDGPGDSTPECLEP